MRDFQLTEYAIWVFVAFASVLMCTTLLAFYLSIDPSEFPMTLVYILAVSTSSAGVLFLLSTYKLIYCTRVVLDPFGHFLKNAKELDQGGKLSALVAKLKNTTGSESLHVMLSEDISSACAIGDRIGKATIFVPKSLASALDQEHLEVVLLHEFYHIKEDVREQNDFVISDIVRYEPISFMLPFLGSAILYGVEYTLLSPYTGYLDPAAKLPLYFLPLALIIVVICILALTALTYYQKSASGVWMSEDSLYIRELLADAYSLFTSTNPQSLRESIIESHIMNRAVQDKKATTLLFEGSDKKMKSATWTLKEAFRQRKGSLRDWMRWFRRVDPYTVCPVETRLAMVDSIWSIMKEYHELQVDNGKAVKITNILPVPIHRLLKKKREEFAQFLEFVKVNSTSFNLEECSKTLRLAPFDTFLMLIGALELDLLGLKNQTDVSL